MKQLTNIDTYAIKTFPRRRDCHLSYYLYIQSDTFDLDNLMYIVRDQIERSLMVSTRSEDDSACTKGFLLYAFDPARYVHYSSSRLALLCHGATPPRLPSEAGHEEYWN